VKIQMKLKQALATAPIVAHPAGAEHDGELRPRNAGTERAQGREVENGRIAWR
jgi:hypothetical protein